jgi:hypothetical protein
MRWPRPRFTVRRIMIAVAILALSLRAILWVDEMRTRSALYDRRACEFTCERTGHPISGWFITRKDGTVVSIHDDEYSLLNDAWASNMARKYWRLSDYPWLSVEPDLPCPERLAHHKDAFNCSLPVETGCWYRESRPPAWTFLWTWR